MRTLRWKSDKFVVRTKLRRYMGMSLELRETTGVSFVGVVHWL